MRLLTFFLLALSIQISASAQSIAVVDLTCEHKVDPMGVDAKAPRFSWKIDGAARNIQQSAYSIQVSTNADFSGNMAWLADKVASDQSVLVAYAGNALKSAQRYYWRVKVWDQKGNESPWSKAAFWETGLLSTSDWKARWIELDTDTGRYAPSPVLRKEFSLKKKVAAARLYVTSHGYYELHINGAKAGDEVLTPGWTVYTKRLQYQVYDVTPLLKTGGNAIATMLGEGWYRGTLGWGDNWAIYGKKLGLLCQLQITYSDGAKEVIVSDKSWKATNDGPIRMNDIYNGETYDARKELTGWDNPSYNDSKWKNVQVANYSNDNLLTAVSVPVQKIQELKPVKIWKTPKGELVADMGQNMVGWIRLKVNGPAGTTVTIRHAEVLDKEGNFYTENLRAAKVELIYTLKGGGDEIYEPRFTFMGFRYVQVDGFPGELTPDNLTGVVVHSNMPVTGSFESSNALLNQLQHNIQWGQKGNFVDVPTDCPQRDERLGWTGDAQAFCRTAAFNMDVSAFFSKWLRDVAADQKGGAVPFVIPDVLNRSNPDHVGTSAGWGDVAVIAPWTMYQVFGDKRLLETQYPSMKAWVEYIRNKAGDSCIWKGGSVFGDWLFYHPPIEDHTAADGFTDHDFIATAFFAYSTKLLSMAAKELGKADEEANYNNLFAKIKEAFNHEYVTAAGRVGTGSQTSYVLALHIGLLSDDLKPRAAQFLASDVMNRDNHLSTGFLGTPYLCHVLSDNGFTSLAYKLLLQQSYPSWLYPVKMGATTIWERWDGEKPDSTFEDAGMNSFNHYAYGAIGDWMYRVVAGIEIGKPGYKQILIQPSFSDSLSYAKASFESSYGLIASGWERKDGKMIVSIRIPANTTALVTLPGTDASKVSESGKPISGNVDFANVRSANENVQMQVGSGQYVFEYPATK